MLAASFENPSAAKCCGWVAGSYWLDASLEALQAEPRGCGRCGTPAEAIVSAWTDVVPFFLKSFFLVSPVLFLFCLICLSLALLAGREVSCALRAKPSLP